MAYLKGQRKPYVGPISLFMIANGLFFATESLTRGTVFTTPIHSHLHTQPWSSVAVLLVSHRLQALQTTLDVYAPVFDHAMAKVYFLAGARRFNSSNQLVTMASVEPVERAESSTRKRLRSDVISQVVVEGCRNSSRGVPARKSGLVATSTAMSFATGMRAQ